MAQPVYLDYNATTPLDPVVAEAMLPFLRGVFGNPSSGHVFGQDARRAVEHARSQVAAMLGGLPEEIIFTSGGTEANNLAIKGIAFARCGQGRHIITSAVEHPAVLEVFAHLRSQGFETSILPVDHFGMVSVKDVEKAIRPDTVLISVMHANNEVGTIQPIKEIAQIAHSHNILMHSDAAQSIGKIPVSVVDLGVDLLSVAGHKFYAPKGVGALYIRAGIKLEKQMHGASHERDLRSGTENVLEIAGLGVACDLVRANLAEYQLHFTRMRNLLEHGLLNACPGARVNGHPVLRLPNTCNMSFPRVLADQLLNAMASVAASAGAACHSGGVTISHVLKAMDVDKDFAKGTLRFSVGRLTTETEVFSAVDEITRAYRDFSL